MKLRVDSLCRTAVPFSAVLVCLALVAHAAPAETNATSKSSSASARGIIPSGLTTTAEPAIPRAEPTAPAATPAESKPPQSVFVVPTSPSEGRDPFFPHTTRLFGATVADVKTNQPSFVVELALKGISGTREQPLAIINNQTFAAGEENDVVTGTRRVRIRCVEINMSAKTVIIQIGNERRELGLKQPK